MRFAILVLNSPDLLDHQPDVQLPKLLQIKYSEQHRWPGVVIEREYKRTAAECLGPANYEDLAPGHSFRKAFDSPGASYCCILVWERFRDMVVGGKHVSSAWDLIYSFTICKLWIAMALGCQGMIKHCSGETAIWGLHWLQKGRRAIFAWSSVVVQR